MQEKWTLEQEQLLHKFMPKGYTHKEVAKILNDTFNTNRTFRSVSRKCERLGIASLNSKIETSNNIKRRINKIHSNIIIIGELDGMNTYTTLKCKVCGNIWKSKPSNTINSKSGCPKCSAKNNKGYYGSMSKEQAEEFGKPLFLYIVKLKYLDEIFYKRGLTEFDDRRRFKKFGLYEVIEELSFELYDTWLAICKEKEIVPNYIPKHSFGGSGECYLL